MRRMSIEPFWELIGIGLAGIAGYLVKKFRHGSSSNPDLEGRLHRAKERLRDSEHAYYQLEHDYREAMDMLRNADLKIRELAQELHDHEKGC